MKKLLSILICAMLCLTATLPAMAEEETYTVGICQLVQHDALDAATQGFRDALTELLGDRVTFDEQNASGDSATCITIINSFIAEDVDLIMANATAALQAAQAGTGDIPILGTSVTDYGTALGIDDWTGTSGTNISGTSDLAPLDQQAAMIQELFPDAKEVGLLYCSAEPNSVYQIDVITGYLTEMGYNCTEYAFTDSNDVASVATNALRGQRRPLHPDGQHRRLLHRGHPQRRRAGGRAGRRRRAGASAPAAASRRCPSATTTSATPPAKWPMRSSSTAPTSPRCRSSSRRASPRCTTRSCARSSA